MIWNKSNRFGVVVSILFLAALTFLFSSLMLLIPLSLQSTAVFATNYTSSCMDLTTENETYILTADISTNTTCFTFLASNIVLDGNGSTIYVNDTPYDMIYAINLTQASNSTIQNITINGTLINTTAIYVNGSNNTQITSVNITNSTIGIWNDYSNGSVFTNIQINSSSTSTYGAYFKDSNNVTLRTFSIFDSPVSPVRILRVLDSIFTNLSLGATVSVTVNIESTNLTLYNLTKISQPINLDLVSSSQFLLNIFNITSITLNSGNSYITLKNGFLSDSAQPVSLYDISNSRLENISWYNISGPNLRFSTSSGVNNPNNLTFSNLNFTSGNETDISTSNDEGHNGTLTFNNTILNLYDIKGVGFRFQYKINNLSVNFSTPVNGTGNFSSNIQFKNESDTSVSIYVNDSTNFNQSLNITFFNLLTNYSSQKIYRNNTICISPQCSNLSSLNQTVVSWVVDRAGNFTIVDIGTRPPNSITGLTASATNNNNITWNWTNPSDVDFNETLIFINDTNVANLSNTISSYTATGLLQNLGYNIRIRTIDYDGYINTTEVSLNSSTTLDSIAPGSVGNLVATRVERDVITFNWTLPSNSDHHYLSLALDGAIVLSPTNATNITFTGLTPNTNYNLTITSFDINGNSNSTNNVTSTIDDSILTNTITDCGTISASGDYILGASEILSNYTCIYITASDVSLDGNGSIISFGAANDSANVSGISVTSASNVTVRNTTIISNTLLNLSRRGIFVGQSSDVTFDSLTINQSTIGALVLGSSSITINNSNITHTNISLIFNQSSQNIIVNNVDLTNTTAAIIAVTNSVATLTDVLVNNATSFAINVSNTSHLFFDQFNWTLSTNTTSAFLLDSRNTTTFSNSSITYGNAGSILFTNFSSGNLSLYSIRMLAGNFSLSKQNASAVNFALNSSTIDSFNFTRDIILGYNAVFANATATPFLNRSAMITFYDMVEETPVYKLRNGVEFNTSTTPFGSSLTSLTSRSPVINTTSLDGNYTLRGFTLRLLSPTNDTVIESESVEFLYYATATYGREIAGCNLTLNGTIINQRYNSMFDDETIFDYTYDDLIDDANYTWTVNCIDNLSASNTKTGNFTVDIPEEDVDSSGAFGSGSGAATPWINTFMRDSAELSNSFSIVLRLWDGVRLKVNNNSHHVGLIALTATTATVNVSSTPQQATLSINESKTFSVDDNETMGIVVTLNSVTSTTANITIGSVYVGRKVSGTNSTTSGSSSQSNATTSVNSQTGAATSSGYAPSAGVSTVFGQFVTTKGIVAILIIGGIILFCGILYYIYLFMKYKKGLAQPLNQLSAKKGFLAEFLFPFMPGGEYWQNKKNEKEVLGKLANKDGPNPEYVKRYLDTIVQLVPPAHASHIEGRLKLGNTFDYIEFELIENGYTREQAKSLVKKYQIDQFVKNCILAGATNQQVKDQLLSSGWPSDLVSSVFKPIEEKKKYELL